MVGNGPTIPVKEWQEWWSRHLACAQPQAGFDYRQVEDSIKAMYCGGGLDEPKRIIWCDSPYAMITSQRDTMRSEHGGLARKKLEVGLIKAITGQQQHYNWAAHVLNGSSYHMSSKLREEANIAAVGLNHWFGLVDRMQLAIVRELSRTFFRDPDKASFNYLQFPDFLPSVLILDYLWRVVGIRNEVKHRPDLVGHMLTYCRSVGNAIFARDICWLCRPPTGLQTTTRGDALVLHSLTGPAVDYPDGFGACVVNGTSVPGMLISHPEKLTVKMITHTRNLEVRRAMMEVFGMARYVIEAGGRVIDTAGPNYKVKGLRNARLLSLRQAGFDGPLTVLELVNSSPEPDGTYRIYHLNVNPKHYHGMAGHLVHAAAASLYRDPRDPTRQTLMFPNWRDYHPDIET